jgi:hypothetical protein
LSNIFAFEKQHVWNVVFTRTSFQRCITYSCVASLPVPYYSTFSHKRKDFQKEFIECKTCVFFSTYSSETFLILEIVQLYIAINLHWSSCKVSVILARCSLKLNLSADYLIILKSNFMNISPVEAELFHAGRQADRHDKA